MARWLGIDHGVKRIGVAVGDTVSRIASPVELLLAGAVDVPARIAELAEEYAAVGVVVGWPLNADGSEGRQSRLAQRFAATVVDRTHLDVRLWDERLSSFQADRQLQGRLTRKKKKRRHDALAAAVMLGDFLALDGPDSAPRPPGQDPSG